LEKQMLELTNQLKIKDANGSSEASSSSGGDATVNSNK